MTSQTRNLIAKFSTHSERTIIGHQEIKEESLDFYRNIFDTRDREAHKDEAEANCVAAVTHSISKYMA